MKHIPLLQPHTPIVAQSTIDCSDNFSLEIPHFRTCPSKAAIAVNA